MIPRLWHGVAIDIPYVLVVAASPYLFGFADVPIAVLLTRVNVGLAVLYFLLTRAEFGVFRILPFRGHLLIDIGLSLFTVAAPWLFGFADHAGARNFFLGIGVFGLVAVALTRAENLPEGQIRASGGPSGDLGMKS